MRTGKEFTDRVRTMLKEADENGKYLYVASAIAGGNPTRVIRVKTERGVTLATSIHGGNFPVSSINIDKFYIM